MKTAENKHHCWQGSFWPQGLIIWLTMAVCVCVLAYLHCCLNMLHSRAKVSPLRFGYWRTTSPRLRLSCVAVREPFVWLWETRILSAVKLSSHHLLRSIPTLFFYTSLLSKAFFKSFSKLLSWRRLSFIKRPHLWSVGSLWWMTRREDTEWLR